MKNRPIVIIEIIISVVFCVLLFTDIFYISGVNAYGVSVTLPEAFYSVLDLCIIFHQIAALILTIVFFALSCLLCLIILIHNPPFKAYVINHIVFVIAIILFSLMFLQIFSCII